MLKAILIPALALALVSCASHRPVKVRCSGVLVRINPLVPPVEPAPDVPDAQTREPLDGDGASADGDPAHASDPPTEESEHRE